MKKLIIALLIIMQINGNPKDDVLEALKEENSIKRLHCPWRDVYLEKKEKRRECPFCSCYRNSKDDNENFMLKRFKYNMLTLNLYPYNPGGHMLIIPYQHVGNLKNLNIEARAELIEIINLCEQVLIDKMNVDGINVGINIGSAAGASIPEHIHIHIVPRFKNDIGFLTASCGSHPVGVDIPRLYEKLKDIFDKI